MRGIYTAGVLDVLLEHQIEADGVMGVSAGAIHGCSYVARQQGRSIRYYLKYCGQKQFMSLHSLLTTGSMVGEQFCYHDIPERLDPFDNEAFEQSKTKFYAVCSNLKTGQAEYHLCPTLRAEQMQYLLASASMPLVSRIVTVDGKELLDGGVCDSIPVKAMQKLGYDRLIVVLTRPKGYRKAPFRTGLAKFKYRRYPAFLQALSRRHEIYNQALDDLEAMEQAGQAFVIRPTQDLHISRMEKNREKIQLQYDLGYSDAASQLDALAQFIQA